MAVASPDESVASSSNDSLSSLNSQLLSHGWSKRPLNLDALSERDLGEVISVFFELLGSSITNIESLDAVSSRHRILQYEFERVQKTVTTARAAQRRAESETSGWKSRAMDLEKRLEQEEAKYREMRDEAGRGRKALEGVRIASGHETKKLQLKLDQANAKLVKLAHDSSVMTRSSGMVVLNPIIQTRSQPMVTGSSPLLEQSIRELDEIRQGLEEETEAFRHVVVSTGNLLREALAMASGSEVPPRLHQSQFFSTSSSGRSSSSSQSAPSISHPQIASDRLQTLITTLRSKLEAKIIRITIGDGILPLDPEEVEEQARAEREKEKEAQDLLDRVKDLEIEVECTRAREEEAKRSLDEYVRAQMQETMAKASDRDNDTSDLLEIMREREKLEDERRRMVEAMGKLSKEKRVFERERSAFESERHRVDVDDVLAQLPSTPLSGSSSSSEASNGSSSTSASSSVSTSSIASIPTFEVNSSSPIPEPEPSIPETYILPPWAHHRPHSPSPLSPHKPRTPEAHIAKTKRAKTPLSRLVLEKAVRRRSQGLIADQAGPSVSSSTREALGEGSKRLNAAPVVRSSGLHGDLGKSHKGKERAGGRDRDKLTASTKASEAKKLGESMGIQAQGSALGVSQRRSQGSGLGRSSESTGRISDGGVKMSKGKAVWR